jgi:serine/threonine-protein kinase
VVSIGVGSFFGLRAMSLDDDSNKNGCREDNHCTEGGAAIRRDAQSAGNLSTVFFALGGAMALGGLLTYLTAPKPVTVTPTAGGILVRGHF